jgi:hypothetical protein
MATAYRGRRPRFTMRTRLILAVLVVLILGTVIVLRVLGETTPVTPLRAAIVGTWTNPDGARLILRPDSTYTASGMPYIDDGMQNDALPGNGSGTWEIEPWDSSSGSGGGVDLTADSGSGTFLTTAGDPARPEVFATIGDPDDGDDFDFSRA